MSESDGGDHDDPSAAPEEGANAQHTPGVEVIQVETGKTTCHAKA